MSRFARFMATALVVIAGASAPALADWGPEAYRPYEHQPAPPPQAYPAPQDYQGPEAYPAPPFHQELAPHGTWTNVDGYGPVWQPRISEVGRDFQPYVTGCNWQQDGSRWSLRSRWSWAPRVFRYGHWMRTPALGWVWMPGSVYHERPAPIVRFHARAGFRAGAPAGFMHRGYGGWGFRNPYRTYRYY